MEKLVLILKINKNKRTFLEQDNINFNKKYLFEAGIAQEPNMCG